jgi:chondroitin 4-sulfotransferase 11
MSFIFGFPKHNNRYMFIHIPKTGGKSTIQAFKSCSLSILECRGHLTITETLQQIDFNNFKSFSIIRNPWDRAVSYYHYMSQLPLQEKKHYFMPYSTFEEFVNFFISDKNPIYRPQIDFLINSDRDIIVDFVLRLENIQKDLDKFLLKNNIQEKIILPKVNTSKHNNYKEHYNDSLVKKIGLYERDIIKKFKYTF